MRDSRSTNADLVHYFFHHFCRQAAPQNAITSEDRSTFLEYDDGRNDANVKSAPKRTLEIAHIAKVQARSMSTSEAQRAAALMSAMASEHRLRILTELLYGGRYASELEAVLKALSPSTISSHLKTLQESGLVVQEGDRGRYLITLPGRIALKMATRLARFLDRRKS